MEEKSYKGLKTIRELRLFGFSFAAGMLLLSAVAYIRDYPSILRIALAAVIVFHLLFAVLYPRLLLFTYILVNTLLRYLGNTILYFVFAAAFYTLLSPFFILLRVINKDVIKHKSPGPMWDYVPEKDNDPNRIAKLF